MDAYLIQLTDEHLVEVVVSHMITLIQESKGKEVSKKFSDTCNKLFDEDKVVELLNEILDQLPLVLEKGTPQDQQAVLSVVVFLLRDFEEKDKPKAFDKLLGSLQKVVSKDKEDLEKAKAANNQNQLQLDALITVYNITGNSDTLFKAIQFAIEAELHETLAPTLVQQLLPQIEDLNLSKGETFDLILAMVGLLNKCKGEIALKELYKLMDLGLKKVPADKLEAAQEMAQKIVVEVLRNPDSHRADIMDYPAVQRLEKVPELSDIYELLLIMRNADIDTFLQKNFQSVLEKVQISKEQFLLKIQTLALLRMVEKGESSFTFEQVANVLKCEEAQVEGVVLNAVGRGMLSGRMNQVEKKLDVTSTVCVNMQQKSWNDLLQRVKELRTSLNEVQGSIASVEA
eukprot:TRINITY_DN3108_c0_g1_i1.p1 TRINITY_DN3108_c0_g1~~TRINITY_DN3108_c0_g1_i1.p1  ORF type:complete len:400 (-),score=59.46 TRINITY_DN3108_c0_g1_i1:236-1435(-)